MILLICLYGVNNIHSIRNNCYIIIKIPYPYKEVAYEFHNNTVSQFLILHKLERKLNDALVFLKYSPRFLAHSAQNEYKLQNVQIKCINCFCLLGNCIQVVFFWQCVETKSISNQNYIANDHSIRYFSRSEILLSVLMSEVSHFPAYLASLFDNFK